MTWINNVCCGSCAFLVLYSLSLCLTITAAQNNTVGNTTTAAQNNTVGNTTAGNNGPIITLLFKHPIILHGNGTINRKLKEVYQWFQSFVDGFNFATNASSGSSFFSNLFRPLPIYAYPFPLKRL